MNHSFEDVASALIPSLARYLRRQVKDNTVVEDLLQETLIRIARGLPDFAGRSSIKTWALAIAGRVTIDHFRRHSGQPPFTDLEVAAQLPDAGRMPEDTIAVHRMDECLHEVIDSLPGQYREAVLLHDFAGLSARETATACGCSESNAKVRIHRARTRLKAALERKCELYHDSDNGLRCHPKE